MTSRTSGTSETPSSASRSSSSSSSASQRLVVLLERRAGAERLGGADELADSREDVVARGDAELERVARREPELVDAVQVRRVGDGDAQHAVLERVRNRDDALEHVQRDLSRGFLVDADEREVDERQLVPGREDPRDALARGDAFLDERRASEPCCARPRASASLSAGTSLVAASRSTTSSASLTRRCRS